MSLLRTPAHEHEFRYYAAVNIDIDNKIVGVVDMWRCVSCRVKSAELRAQGLSSAPSAAGFTNLDGPDMKWVLLVCSSEEVPKVDLLRCRPGDVLDHDCVEKVSELIVADNYSLENENDRYHRILDLEGYLNENVDVRIEESSLLPINSISMDWRAEC